MSNARALESATRFSGRVFLLLLSTSAFLILASLSNSNKGDQLRQLRASALNADLLQRCLPLYYRATPIIAESVYDQSKDLRGCLMFADSLVDSEKKTEERRPYFIDPSPSETILKVGQLGWALGWYWDALRAFRPSWEFQHATPVR